MSKQKRIKVEELTVSVTYTVSLLELMIPEEAHKQIIEAFDAGDTILLNSLAYEHAEDWLAENIKESDSMDWEVEIYDITIP